MATSRTEPARTPAREFPIDFSLVPENVDVPDSTRAEYYGRVYVLHCVLDQWKKPLSHQVQSILPWLEADARIGEKWERLTREFHYRVVAHEKQNDLLFELDTEKRVIRLNLKKGVYLDSDPAFILVGAILDAEYHHSRSQQDRRSETAVAEPGNASMGITDEVWRHKRTLSWQMDWYLKATRRNPLIQRERISETLDLYRQSEARWREGQVAELTARLGRENEQLIKDAWDFNPSRGYDLPN